MFTELAIKAALDGTFTSIRNHDQAVVTVKVPVDFTPTHQTPAAFPSPPKEAPKKPKRPWTADEDAELLRLVRGGWSIQRTAKALGRGFEVTRRHYHMLTDGVF